MKGYRKITALLLVFVLLLIGAGCSPSLTLTGGNTTWVYRTKEAEIPAGQYITSQLVELSNFLAKVNQEIVFEPGEEPSSFLDVLDLELDGETGREYVQRTSQRYSRTALAVSQESARLGVSIPDYYYDNLMNTSSQAWQSERAYFESNGVAESSYVAFNLDAALREELFFTLYEEGGERAMPEGDVEAAFVEDFVLADALRIPLADAYGMDEREPEEYEAYMREVAGEFLERAKAGESAEQLEYDLNLLTAPEELHDSIELSPEGNLSVLISGYDTIMQNYIEGGEEALARLVLESKGKEPFLHDGGDGTLTLILPKELSPAYENYIYMRPYILTEYKTDDYEAYLDQVAEALGIESNPAALKRYTPDKIKEQPYTGQPQYTDEDLMDFDLSAQ